MRARYVHIKREIDVSAAMPAPKKVCEPLAWLKTARKAIPEIPDVLASDWKIKNWKATTDVVTFHLCNQYPEHDRDHEFAIVVIYRKAL